jgi:DNA-binding CsgD family transcriptional regulator
MVRFNQMFSGKPSGRSTEPSRGELSIDSAEIPHGAGSLRYLVLPTAWCGALAKLAPAERDIAERVVRGQSNQLIAKSRGTSARTVANQLQSIYAKLGVASRYELIDALVAGRTDPGA